METNETATETSTGPRTIWAVVALGLIIAGFAALIAALDSRPYVTVLALVGVPLAIWSIFVVVSLGREDPTPH